MRSEIASVPGHPGRANEDWAGTGPRTAVVLDGLTESAETGCLHGTPWYVEQLGTALLRLAADPAVALPEALSGAITHVAGLHGGQCDLGHPGTPASTVALLRTDGAGSADYLVLSDATVVLDLPGEVRAVSDPAVDDHFTAQQAGAATASGLSSLIQAQQQIRNQPGGYWVAQVDPAAAGHAHTGTVSGLRGAALLSDGVSLLVTGFGALEWHELLAVGYAQGPGELIARTRACEDADPERVALPRHKHHDDATAVICHLGGGY
ncbi:hypothetical protein [Longispora albida]|uniref:hypothetical protein n=1 Tax=Longispora albida TaxID=203523 RepID=UPI0003600F00|nr:hypothetical protein [Longispora albida]